MLKATHALVPSWVDAGIAGLRIDHPTAWSTRRSTWTGCGRWRQRPGSRWRRSWRPGEELPPSWPVAGTTGYDAMREVNGVFVDPRPGRRVHRAVPAADRRPALDRRARRAGQADGGADPAAGGGAEDGRPGARGGRRRRRPWLRWRWPSRCTAPTCRRGSSTWTAPWPRPPSGDPTSAAALAALSPRLHDPADELARRMQQLSGATMAKGVEDTAYYRYARFVALNEVGGDPGQFGIPVAEFHALQARAAGQPAGVDDRPVHPRHQARGGRPGPAGRAGRDRRRTGRRSPPSSFGPRRCRTGRSATSWPRPWSGPGRSSGTGCTRTRRRRCARPVTAPPGPSPTRGFEATVHEAVDLAYDDAAAARRLGPDRRADHRAGLGQRAGAEAGAADHAGDTRRLPGNRGLGELAGRPGQPAAGGLRGAPRGCWPRSSRLGSPSTRRGGQALGDPAAALRRPPRPARAVHRLHPASRPTGRRRSIWSGSTAAARSPWRPGCPSAWLRSGGWGSTTVELPDPVTDALTGASYAGRTAVADLLGRYPVALLLPTEPPSPILNPPGPNSLLVELGPSAESRPGKRQGPGLAESGASPSDQMIT